MKKPNADTHQACRSLLQKAVRRGDVDLTRQTAHHLQRAGDARWLRGRAAVIAFEECWPLVADVNVTADANEAIECLVRVAESVKFKDAAGLGSLAYALSIRDCTARNGSSDDRHINAVCEAIRRPADFWKWAIGQELHDRQRTLIHAAYRAHRQGGWPWDRAFMQAAAYLAATQELPEAMPARSESARLPLWVALDKHTPQGKAVLRSIAKRVGVPWRQLLWTK
jgi:hypothetical protein